jgi:hypothetical protein
MYKYLYSISFFAVALFAFLTDWYLPLAVVLTFLVVFQLINKLGKGIVLLETIAFLYIFTCVFMPYLGYVLYPKSENLSFLWKRFMPVNERIYFSFTLPALCLFCMVLTWPLKTGKFSSEFEMIQYLRIRIVEKLSNHRQVGLVIISIGLVFSFIYPYIPGSFQFFVLLFYFSSFAGLLYVYYTPSLRYKYWIIGGFSLFLLLNALNTGMFTVVAYMGLTIFSFFFLGNKASFFKKFSFFIIGFLLLIVLQNTKKEFRAFTWGKKYEGSKVELFSEIFVNNFSKGEDLFAKNTFFPIYMRTNQGFNIALVMKRFPSIYPHDNGKFMVTNVASSLVPRFLWPDKPEAGGKFNMKYYTGWTITNWSTNIGPLGEAYGAFGFWGGILFMGLLALFVRWIYKRLITLSFRYNPLLICWIPVLFYQVTYSGETDTLQIVNALLKTAFFIFLLYRIVPTWFGNSREGNSVRLQDDTLQQVQHG